MHMFIYILLHTDASLAEPKEATDFRVIGLPHVSGVFLPLEKWYIGIMNG